MNSVREQTPEAQEVECAMQRSGPSTFVGTGGPRHINSELLQACRDAADLLTRMPTTRLWSLRADERLEQIKAVIERAEIAGRNL